MRCNTSRILDLSCVSSIACLILSGCVAFAGTTPCDPARSVCEYSQSSLVLMDWTATPYYFPQGVTKATASLSLPDSAEFPKNSLRLHTIPGLAPTEHGAWITMFANYAFYDTPRLGAIKRLALKQSMILSVAYSDTPQDVYGLVRQGGNDFVVHIDTLKVMRGRAPTPVQTVSKEVVANDFARLESDGTLNSAVHPDFSAAGAVIRFGVAHLSKLQANVDSDTLRGPVGRNVGTVSGLSYWSVFIEH